MRILSGSSLIFTGAVAVIISLFLLGELSQAAQGQSDQIQDQPVKTASSEIQQRAQDLYKRITCLVCEGQLLAGSQAEIAQAMRREILADLKNRHGDKILTAPPFKTQTSLLWLAPALLLLSGVFLLRNLYRRKRPETG